MGLLAAFDRLARVLTRAGTVVLLAMMMITVADVTLRHTLNVPIFGTFDLVEFFLVLMTFLAMPETFLREEHILVELVDHVVSERVRQALRVIAEALALALLVLMMRQMIRPAFETLEFNDQTMDLGIPKFWHWVAILVGIGCSIVALVFIILRDIGRIFAPLPVQKAAKP